jgi:uncharacterized protein (UPF0264 family)
MNFHNESRHFRIETGAEENGLSDPACRPQLLISVRDLAEFRSLLGAGVDVIDLKEPRAGALSPTDSRLWRQVAQEWSQRAGSTTSFLSAALGESAEALAVAQLLPAEFHFAKAGPSRCRTQADLVKLWRDVRGRLDPAVELVAVAYADYDEAECPPPEEVLKAAAEFGLRRCLLDTFTKDARSSIERLGLAKLRSFGELAKQLELWWALAGSIREQEIGRLLASEIVPNCVGVRGDVCDRSREGKMRLERVQSWITALHECEPNDAK